MSHRQSAQSGISEATQLDVCKRYAYSLRLNPTFGKQKFPEDMPNGVFCDRARSAWRNKLADRPAGAALLSILKPGDEVIFYNVERAYRTVVGFCQETEMLLDSGITPHFVMNNLDFSSATGKMIGRILAVIAEYYSDMISERTKEALAIRREQGGTEKPARKKSIWETSNVYVPPTKPKIITELSKGYIRSYVRVSHESSTQSGLGLEHQRQANKAYAMRLIAENPNLQYVESVYEDKSVSAFHNPLHKREAGAKLLTDLQPGDHLLFYRCDRGFRTPYDCATTAKQLEQSQIAMHLVDSGINSMSPIGRLYIHLLSVFGALESEIKSQRNTEIAAIAKASGRPAGTTPMHCRVREKKGRKVLEYDFDAIAICAACWMLHEIGMTCQQIPQIVNRLIAKQKDMSMPFVHRRKLSVDEVGVEGRIDRWNELVGNIPRIAVQQCASAAVELLESPVPQKIKRHCKYVNLPMENIAGRLAAAGIELEPLGLTQDQVQSASILV